MSLPVDRLERHTLVPIQLSLRNFNALELLEFENIWKYIENQKKTQKHQVGEQGFQFTYWGGTQWGRIQSGGGEGMPREYITPIGLNIIVYLKTAS